MNRYYAIPYGIHSYIITLSLLLQTHWAMRRSGINHEDDSSGRFTIDTHASFF